jgi:hypothetical protein|tara:strand:+ start:203 stop:484 length:282 start_codon:yes stop_codon:yes gene_type:complete
MLTLILLANINTNVVNHPNPSTAIYCPVFMTRAKAVFGGPDTTPTPLGKILQRSLCFNQVVKPLQDFCILEGYEEKRCKARTLTWIKAGRKKK